MRRPPTYTIAINPTIRGTRTHLYDGRRASLRLVMGQKHAISNFRVTSPAPASLGLPDTVPLTVTMACLACADNSVQMQTVDYSLSKNTASKAMFNIVPRRRLTRRADGLSHIVFDIHSRGVQFDHQVFEIHVEPPPGVKEDKVQSRPMPSLLSRLGTVPQADIIFSFALGQDGFIQVKVEPIHVELRGLFREKYRRDGQLRSFTSHTVRLAEIENLEGATYGALRSIVQPADSRVRSDTGVGASAGTPISLSREQRDDILDKFFTLGSRLYYWIFSGDPELYSLMQQFDRFSLPDRPIRVQINAAGIYLPWQFLHPPGELIADKFWGFRYELAVNPLARLSNGPLPDTLVYTDQEFGIFAAYHGESKEDVAARLGREQAKKVEADIRTSHAANSFTPFLLVDSRETFVDAIKQHSDSLAFLFAFTHATSGTFLAPDTKGQLVVERDAEGQRLFLLSNKDYVSPEDILDISLRRPDYEYNRLFFPTRPLVLLNACETGTAGFSQTTNLGFAGTLLNLGARGVIVTEAPLWTWFGYYFGNDLISGMLTGIPIAQNVRLVRNKYLTFNNNPLGLLYSYYGNPNATARPVMKFNPVLVRNPEN